MSEPQPRQSAATPRTAASGDSAMLDLVREMASRTGLRIEDGEIPQVAALLGEYLGHVQDLDAVEVELGATAPLGFDLLRWLSSPP